MLRCLLLFWPTICSPCQLCIPVSFGAPTASPPSAQFPSLLPVRPPAVSPAAALWGAVRHTAPCPSALPPAVLPPAGSPNTQVATEYFDLVVRGTAPHHPRVSYVCSPAPYSSMSFTPTSRSPAAHWFSKHTGGNGMFWSDGWWRGCASSKSQLRIVEVELDIVDANHHVNRATCGGPSCSIRSAFCRRGQELSFSAAMWKSDGLHMLLTQQANDSLI